MVEFVSYNGCWPNLCSGTLVLKIDGEEVVFPDYCMSSGGSVWFDIDWEEFVGIGPWTVYVPSQYKQYDAEIQKVVNEHVPWGCCGGCV